MIVVHQAKDFRRLAGFFQQGIFSYSKFWYDACRVFKIENVLLKLFQGYDLFEIQAFPILQFSGEQLPEKP